MKLWYDCEFLEDGRTVDLISIGIVADDGREYYAVSEDVTKRPLRNRIRKHDWLMANVVPSLPKFHGDANLTAPGRWLFNYSDPRVKPRHVIAREVRDFILAAPGPELWAWYGAYDHVALCQLWGTMMHLPKGVPMWTNDLKQECERLGNPQVPKQASGEHNALEDARHNREIDRFLSEIAYAMGVERGYGT